MDYEIKSRRRQRLEKKRLNLVRFSGVANPYCVTCNASDIVCLHIDRATRTITCRNCRLKRLRLTETARKKRARCFAELGYPNPTCVVCGEDDICLMEEHHFFGEGNSRLSGPLCANCHAIQSDMQCDFSVDVRRRDPDRRALVYQAAFLLGVFILLTVLGFRERTAGSASLGTALNAIGGLALMWAYWNVYADGFFAMKFGKDYDKGMSLSYPS